MTKIVLPGPTRTVILMKHKYPMLTFSAPCVGYNCCEFYENEFYFAEDLMHGFGMPFR